GGGGIPGVPAPFSPRACFDNDASSSLNLFEDGIHFGVAVEVVRKGDRCDSLTERASADLRCKGGVLPEAEQEMGPSVEHEDVVDIEERAPAQAIHIEATRSIEVAHRESDE